MNTQTKTIIGSKINFINDRLNEILKELDFICKDEITSKVHDDYTIDAIKNTVTTSSKISSKSSYLTRFIAH